MKKKILVWETLPTVSGGQKMTLKIMDILSDNYEFLCLIPAKGRMSEELQKRGIPYIILGDQSLPTGIKSLTAIFKYFSMSVRCILRSLSAIRKYNPDILYAPGPAALPWSAICGTLTKKPVVWHLHHVFLDGMTGKLLNLCSKWKAVRKIISVSNCAGNQIKNDEAHKKVTAFYNPIDVDFYRNGDATRVSGELASLLDRETMPCFDNSGHQDERVITVGHIALVQRDKRQDFVLRTMAELNFRGFETVGIFCGEFRDTDYLEEITSLAGRLGIEKNVLFLGWRNDVPDILKCMDVLVVPSVFEGFSLAGQEAAAAGIPVVACDAAGVSELINNSQAGLLCSPYDPSDAAEKIISVVNDKEKYAECGKKYAENWREEIYRKKLRACFDEII